MPSSLAARPAETLARQLADSARKLQEAISLTESDAVGERWRQLARARIDERLWGEHATQRKSSALPPWVETAAQLMTYGAFLDRCELTGTTSPTPIVGSRGPRGESLAQLLHALPGMPESVRRQARDVARVLDSADIAKVLFDLRTRVRPVCAEAHFYERFLACYAHGQRRQQGVYYTPAPVVHFIVRSVDRVLRDVWGMREGLACPQATPDGRVVRVIDPACGSGTFLLAVLQHAARRSAERSGGSPMPHPGDWTHTLHGFDVQPVACLVARQLLERQLLERQTRGILLNGPAKVACGSVLGEGPPNGGPSPWSVTCANALEQTRLEAAEGGAANCRQYLPVIVGNPPYGNFGRRNRKPWIRNLIADYKMGLHEKKVNLDDDFIKFIRWSQYHVDQAGAGIVALVTSNTYLAGLTHRGMRQSLHGSFDQLYVFDLHGDRKRDVRLDGSSRDENVFDIQQGVAVGLFVKTGRKAGVTRVFHGELKGPRTQKLAALQQGDVVTACTRQLATEEAVSFFVPNRHKAEIAYDDSPSLEQIFLHYVSGVQTKQDALLTDRSRIQLSARVRNLLDRQQAVRPVDKFKGRREPDFKSWPGHPKEAVVFDARCLRPYQVAPFDFRWLYYDPRLLGRPRWSVARHLLRPNLALVFMRQSTNAGDYDHFLASTDLVSDRVFYSGHGAPFFAPLFLDGGPPSLGDPSLDENPGVRGNLQPTFVRRVSRLWRLKFETFAHGDLERAFGARDVFDYAYAIFHSPEFRLRYRERLATGFPRLPLTADLDLARQLCVMGRRLVALHTTLPASRHADTNPWRSGGDYRIRSGYPRFDAPPVGQPQVGPPQVGPDSTSGDAGESGAADEGATGCIRINSETCLERVAEADWQFQVGGYRVIQKWLSARRGTTLGRPQRDHVADLVRISRETRALAFRIQEMLSPWPWA